MQYGLVLCNNLSSVSTLLMQREGPPFHSSDCLDLHSPSTTINPTVNEAEGNEVNTYANAFLDQVILIPSELMF